MCYLLCMHISTGVLEYSHNILLNTFAISRFILNDFFLFVLFVVIIYRTKRYVLLYWRFFTMFVLLFLVPCVPSFRRLFSSKKWSWENIIFVQNKKFIRAGNQPAFGRFHHKNNCLTIYLHQTSYFMFCHRVLCVAFIRRLGQRMREEIHRLDMFDFIIINYLLMII